MSKTIGFFLLVFTLFYTNAKSQELGTVFVSPGIKFGHTLGAGFTYGFTLDVGVQNNFYMKNGKYGVSFNYSFIKVKKYTHRQFTFNLMAQNDFSKIKLGVGTVKNPWGYSKRNKCHVEGFNFDASFSYPNQYSPWIGFSYFKYERAAWAWFMKPYKTIYVNYNYDVLQPVYQLNKQQEIK